MTTDKFLENLKKAKATHQEEVEPLSNCCGAPVYEFDLCSDCKEHCEATVEDDEKPLTPEEEEAIKDLIAKDSVDLDLYEQKDELH